MQIAGLGSGQAATASVAKRDGAASSRDQPAPTAPAIKFSSPTLKYDPQSRLVIFQVLNPDTGDVVRQYPSQKVVKLYQDGSGLGTANPSLVPPIAGVDPNAGKPVSPHPATAGSSTTLPSGSQSPAPAKSSDPTPGTSAHADTAAPPAGQASSPSVKVVA